MVHYQIVNFSLAPQSPYSYHFYNYCDMNDSKNFTLDLKGVMKSQGKLIAIASKSDNEQQFESAL